MSVVSIGHPTLTKADIAAIIARGNELSRPDWHGEWVPVVTDDGETVLALLNSDNEALLFGFGKGQGRYYVFDADGYPLAQGRHLEDILIVLS